MMIIDEMKLSWSIIIMKVSVHSLRQINVLLPLRTFNRSVIPTCWENRDNSEYNASILIRTELRDNRWQIIFPLCSFSVRKSSLFITCEKVEGISNCMWFSENFIQNKKVVEYNFEYNRCRIHVNELLKQTVIGQFACQSNRCCFLIGGSRPEFMLSVKIIFRSCKWHKIKWNTFYIFFSKCHI